MQITDLYLHGFKVAGFMKSVHFFPMPLSKMNAFSWIHLEIAEFVLMCRVDIRACLRYTSVLPAERFSWGVAALRLYPDLRTFASTTQSYMYVHVRPNKYA